MDYITAIGTGFPGVEVSCSGDPTVYANITWERGLALPSQETLDAWIVSNAAVASVRITALAFRKRFTQTEKITMDLAGIDNPAAPMEQRQMAAALRVMFADLASVLCVDLTAPETIEGVNTLEAYGIIGPGRANVILTTPPTDIEIYRGD